MLVFSTYFMAFSVSITLLSAYLLDRFCGEAKRFHYLVGFGWLATQLEKKLNRQSVQTVKENDEQNVFSIKKAFLGGCACLLLILPLPLIYIYLSQFLPWYVIIFIDSVILYLAFALNSLQKHAQQILTPLLENNLPCARHFTRYIVSRQTEHLTSDEMARATVESVLENGHDAVIASIVYYLIGGIPLVILHRLSNTLDAMWGYKNQRFYSFGFFAAKLDDTLGFISGKICTVLYAIQRPLFRSLKLAYQQGNQYKSHNGGWVMAAGATVMHVQLGGCAIYHGKTKQSPVLGMGDPVTMHDIPRSINIVKYACYILFSVVLGYQISMFTFTFFRG